MDVEKMSVGELKIAFFDEQRKHEIAGNNMKVLAQLIDKKEKEVPVKEEPKK